MLELECMPANHAATASLGSSYDMIVACSEHATTATKHAWGINHTTTLTSMRTQELDDICTDKGPLRMSHFTIHL
jgi:hypothetical protein